MDVAIEAVGIPATFDICQAIVAAGGRIANVGVHGKPVQLQLERLWAHNITLTTRLVDTVTTPMLLKLVQSGRLQPAKLVTHRFELADVMKAYDVFGNAAKERALKVVLKNGSERPGAGSTGRPPGNAFWDGSVADLLEQLRTTPAGLTSEEAARRLRLHGPNSFSEESRFASAGRIPALLRQSPRHHPARGQRHVARAGRPGRRPDHHRDRAVERAAELLHGVPGAPGRE